MLETKNLRVVDTTVLLSPDEVTAEIPLSERALEVVTQARSTLQALLTGREKRRLLIVGPCSIHDPAAALDYAERLVRLRERVNDELIVVMRVYFEKPRSTVGWKGLINDPHLDGSYDIATGIRKGRELLLAIANMGLPAATEMLDPIIPQYLADLVAWGAIGARTTESQTHREMASGLSMPIGFKNGTDGSLSVAINGIIAASRPHSFLGIDGAGRVGIVRTRGNRFCHLVLRGGGSGPNYQAPELRKAVDSLSRAGVSPRVVVDCSHDNSGKDPALQPKVLADLGMQVEGGAHYIVGAMLESNLVAGRQDLKTPSDLVYGQSITDGCIDFPTTERAVLEFASSVAGRLSSTSPG